MNMHFVHLQTSGRLLFLVAAFFFHFEKRSLRNTQSTLDEPDAMLASTLVPAGYAAKHCLLGSIWPGYTEPSTSAVQGRMYFVGKYFEESCFFTMMLLSSLQTTEV